MTGQRVVIVKTSGVIGHMPVGSRSEYAFPADLLRENAKIRAWRMWAREHPGENSMCWTISGEAV